MTARTLAYAFVLGILGGTTATAQQLPRFNVEAICRNAPALTAEDRDPVQGCMRDETAAERQLEAVWSSAAPANRATCVGQSEIWAPSYVDVLTCLQMYQGAESTAPPRRRRQP